MRSLLRRHGPRMIAVAAIAITWLGTRLPELELSEREALASRFSFTAVELPTLASDDRRSIRDVHPSVERFAAWISSVGASVALADLDADGLPNDACHVDTRIDRVVVTPVPGTGDRYEPFGLDGEPGVVDRATTAPMGCLPGDLNEDGWTDLLVYYWGRPPIAFLRRPGLGEGRPSSPTDRPSALSSRSYRPESIGPDGERWYTNAVARADLDGDGHLDLVVGNYFPDGAPVLDPRAGGSVEMQHSMSRAFNGGSNRLLLWRAPGEGTGAHGVRYEDASGVLPEDVARGWTLALGAPDVDGDQLPEIYFANDFGPDRLLHNRSEPGRLSFALLEGKGGPATPSSKALGRDSFKGMGFDLAELNDDGRPDLCVSNIAEEFALEESHFLWMSTDAAAGLDVGRSGADRFERLPEGSAPYVDRSEPLGVSRSGWAWDCRFGDFDNDGVPEMVQATGFVKGSVDRWPELHELAMAHDELLKHPEIWFDLRPGDDLSGHLPNAFFVRAPDGRYHDLSAELGLDRPQVSRGIATADVDGDGDLDFAVANQWEPSRFYRNELQAGGSFRRAGAAPTTGTVPRNFLGLHLLLPVESAPPEPVPPRATSHRPGHPGGAFEGRPAVGARVEVRAPGGGRLVDWVDGGSGHSGSVSPALHFGLGGAVAAGELAVEIAWRDGEGRVRTERLSLPPGWHTVVLGTGEGS